MADRLHGVFSRFPYRCRECNRRFRLKTPIGRRTLPKGTGRAGKRQRRRQIQTREALLYGLALLAFAIVAFFVTGERS
jgi:hypothetical protein